MSFSWVVETEFRYEMDGSPELESERVPEILMGIFKVISSILRTPYKQASSSGEGSPSKARESEKSCGGNGLRKRVIKDAVRACGDSCSAVNVGGSPIARMSLGMTGCMVLAYPSSEYPKVVMDERRMPEQVNIWFSKPRLMRKRTPLESRGGTDCSG